jgi:hypothetical protein
MVMASVTAKASVEEEEEVAADACGCSARALAARVTRAAGTAALRSIQIPTELISSVKKASGGASGAFRPSVYAIGAGIDGKRKNEQRENTPGARRR